MNAVTRLAGLFFATLVAIAPTQAAEKRFLLATTTSTENSGLLDVIIPKFTTSTGIAIDVVAVGTGQAMEMGRRGDAAAILVHDRIGEDQFVADGHGADRRDVMYNDFVIIGPQADPARLGDAIDTAQAMTKIASSGAIFVSRGDDSGTHRKELRLWADADLDPTTFGSWYRETGAGMGQTILTATQMAGYTMTDRATWVKFGRKDGYIIAFEEAPPLFNPYASIIVTNPVVPDDETRWATAWHEWLTSKTGQQAISNYRVDDQQLFFVTGDDEAG